MTEGLFSQGAPPIVLMTDFGLQDPFVGILKGVMSGIAPHARVIDLTHGIRPQEVFHGAFVLYKSAEYFPPGSVFCAVVDPGVGTNRRAMAVETRNYTFVGPDNGLMWAAAHKDGIERCAVIENPDFFRHPVSSTFHARDIFAPVAAHLWTGRELTELGPGVGDPAECPIPVPTLLESGLELTVLDKDIYGNLTLNIEVDAFDAVAKKAFTLAFDHGKVHRVYETYGRAPENCCFVVPGSSGFMEVAVKNKSAAAALRADVKDTALLSGTP